MKSGAASDAALDVLVLPSAEVAGVGKVVPVQVVSSGVKCLMISGGWGVSFPEES